MWIDERGAVHLADVQWTTIVHFSPHAYGVLNRTLPAELHDVLDIVEDDVYAVIAQTTFHPEREAEFQVALPPKVSIGLVEPSAAAAELLDLQLRRHPFRWRLDYVFAVRDCLALLRKLSSIPT